MKERSFKEFFYLAHCEGKSPSSKRLYGGIGWIVCLICLVVASVLAFIDGHGLTEIIKDMWEFDLITSSALLGLATIAGAFGGGKNIAIGQPQKPEENDTEGID